MLPIITEKAELSEQQQAETEKKDEFTQEMETLQTDYSQSEEELDRIAREQELQQQIDAENARTEELKELETYTKTKKYAEEVAKDKLGLVYDNEIIFKEED